MGDPGVVAAGAASVGTRTGSRPAGLRAGRVVALAWALAAAVIWVLNQVHEALHEHVELSPLAHWMRDGALAVPLAAIAVVAAALLVSAGVARSAALGATRPAILGRPVAASLAWAVVAAVLFAVLTVPGNQLHGLLFGAEEEEVGWLEDVLMDGGIALAVSLALLVPLALLFGPPWHATPPARPVDDLDAAPGRPAGLSASLPATPTPAPAPLATAESTHVGGDR